MGVVAGYRNKRIGIELITKTINHAQSRGIERIELEVFLSNKAAQKLYKKIGFTQEGVKRKGKKYNGEYEDVIVMGLI